MTKLRYNADLDRFGIWDTAAEKWIDDGLHCGEMLTVRLIGDDQIVSGHMELRRDPSGIGSEWYLCGTGYCGSELGRLEVLPSGK